jgi:hypothetical protein
MFALVAPGTPALQLPAVNQSVDVAPIQLVWARVAKQRHHCSGCQQMCAHRCPPAKTNSHFEQTFCYLKIGVKDVSAWPRRFLESCGFSAALSRALLMTNNQLPTLVGIDAKGSLASMQKSPCNVSIGDEGRELIDTIVRGEEPADSLAMAVNQIAAQANNICSSPAPADDRIASSISGYGTSRT